MKKTNNMRGFTLHTDQSTQSLRSQLPVARPALASSARLVAGYQFDPIDAGHLYDVLHAVTGLATEVGLELQLQPSRSGLSFSVRDHGNHVQGPAQLTFAAETNADTGQTLLRAGLTAEQYDPASTLIDILLGTIQDQDLTIDSYTPGELIKVRSGTATHERMMEMLSDPQRLIPLVVVSETTDGHTLVDARDLAKDLSGIAHVMQMDHQSSFAISDTFGRYLSVFDGAVRVYRPGLVAGVEKAQHPLYLSKRILEEGHEFYPMLIERVSLGSAYSLPKEAANQLTAGRHAPKIH